MSAGPLTASDPDELGGIRLLKRLGSGGVGQVYPGRTPGGEEVAVKTLHPSLLEREDVRARFDRRASG